MSAFDSASYIWHHSTLQPAADAWAPVSGASAEYTFPVSAQLYARWMPPAPTNQQAFVNTNFNSAYKLVLPGHIIDPGRFDVRFLVNFDALNAYISGTTSVELIDAQNWRILFGPASNWIRYYRQSSTTQEPIHQFDLPSSASFSDYSGWKWVRLSPTSSNGHLSTLAALYIADETSSWGAEVDFATTWNTSHYDWGLDQAETFEEGSALDKLQYLPIAEIDIRDITESQVFHWRAIDHENVWTSSAAYYPSSEKVSGSSAGVARSTHPVILDEHAGTFLGEGNFQLQMTGSPVINTGSEYAVAVALKFPSITPSDGLTDSREFYWQGSAGALAQTSIILELVGSDVSNPGVFFNMPTSSSVAPLSASNVGYNEWFVVTRQRRNDVEQGWINDTLVYAASSSENEKSQSYGTSLSFLTLGYDGTSTTTSYGMHAGLAIWTSSSLSDEEIGDLKTLFFPTMADGPPPDLPPIATLYSPISGAVYYPTESVQLSGSATDAVDGDLTGSALQWTSSLDGAIGTGSLINHVPLTAGVHTITFNAVDSSGSVDTITSDILVNSYPTSSLTSPLNLSNYEFGQTVTFSGSITDPEDGTLVESALQWTSSADGALETGSEFTLNTLSAGSHSITLRGADSFGFETSTSVDINIEQNQYPVATIASPNALDNYIFTQNVTFSGSITDPEGGDLAESALQWTSSLDGALETGSEFSLNTLSVGSHSITLRGADVYGLEGSASVDINVAQNQYPTSSIVTPIAAGNYIYGQLLVFSGSSVDPEEGILPESASQWTSSLDGGLETGSEFSLNTLSVGSHSITLRSADSFGLESSSSVSINVTVNQYPTASITSPLNLSSTVIGDPITFSGSATDPEGDSIAGSNLQWTSSLDGGFGTGLSFIDATLSGGSHSITLVAYDSYGLAGSASIDINVDAGGYPTGTIIFPNDGGNYTYGTGTPLQFTGSATDSEDGTLTGSSLVWISDVDGALGTGELLSVPSMTEGFHIITLIAQDSTGKQASSSVTINATSRDVEAAPPEEKEKTVWTKEVTTDPPEKTHQLGYERQDQVVEVTDRGNQTRFADDDSQPISVTLEYIDGAVMAHLVNQVKLEVDAEDKRIAVPVEYASSERWKQFRKDGFLRDGAGVLQIPLLLFRKTRILKGKGMQSPINKYLDRTYQTGWNRHQTYDKFSVLNSIIPSKELISVRVPDYVVVNYEFVVWTDYVEQMNGILERLNFEMDNYWGQRNNFKFNVTVNDYQTETDISPEDNRVIKTEFSAEVKAYLLPETYYHTDKGVKTTSEKRYSYKKVMNIYEIDSGDRITED